MNSLPFQLQQPCKNIYRIKILKKVLIFQKCKANHVITSIEDDNMIISFYVTEQ